MSEALEVRIELAWCVLRGLHPSTRRTLHLTPRGAIVGFKSSQGLPMGAMEIGTYTRAIELDELRQHVFFVWNEMQEPSHGRR